MRWLSVLPMFSSLCVASSQCHDRSEHNPLIGGHTIIGHVELHRKSVESAKVQIYASSGQRVWTGTTDKDGMFATGELPPDRYRLEVSGWGSGNVRLNPDAYKNLGMVEQHWQLLLWDHGCLGSGAAGN